MRKRPKAATVYLGLRVKEPLRARIERAAEENGVSMNTEIITRLYWTFAGDDFLHYLHPKKIKGRFDGKRLRKDARKVK